ncbi:succinyl-CoA:3-ketoacid coenzyme A transferase [Phytophthora cinnamomi]|uniref:succinyl-CoA:3-ketoacid coenzyme A transferase n=1 Tax=Phytophthora cinnamomi TaxID=4785 RepID=UPI00355A8DB3|nr:succinyl-CoA:3-ketoacid coenzyme A transferase [Phytophthora cinnamomi]
MISGTQSERAEYYSAKHKLHGYKTEISVIPTGLAINCSHYRRGSAADISFFRDNKAFHEAAATKRVPEERMPDYGPHLKRFPSSWIILADKGFQGLAETYRAVYPTRRRPTVPLTLEEETTNRNISSDIIVVENYFGRICTMWALYRDKYRWKETKYEMYFRACVALTNVQVRAHRLRADDGENYKNYLRSLIHIGTTRLNKRHESNRHARERRLLRLAIEVPPVDEGDSSGSDDLMTQYSTAY